MAFLLRAFSRVEKQKDKDSSADLVNKTFQAELVNRSSYRVSTCCVVHFHFCLIIWSELVALQSDMAILNDTALTISSSFSSEFYFACLTRMLGFLNTMVVTALEIHLDGLYQFSECFCFLVSTVASARIPFHTGPQLKFFCVRFFTAISRYLSRVHSSAALKFASVLHVGQISCWPLLSLLDGRIQCVHGLFWNSKY